MRRVIGITADRVLRSLGDSTLLHGRFPGALLFVVLFVFASSLVYLFFGFVAEAPEIKVRWAESVTTGQRQILEARLGLATPRMDDDEGAGGRTWHYALLDASTDNVRQLVQDPDVEDTSHIDREHFLVEGETPSTQYWRALHRPLIAGAIGLAVAMLAGWFGRASESRIGHIVTRGVPLLSAGALGLFRVAFAVALFKALLGWRPVLSIGPIEEHRALAWGWVDWLIARPHLVGRLEDALLVLLVLFAIGLWTRLVFGLFAAGLTIWIAVLIQTGTNIHRWELAYLMVLGLAIVAVPWGDAFSADETIRRWRGEAPSRSGNVGKRYGFPVWFPGAVLGAVWLSAAYSKLESSGLEWILSGAVKYHWVIDEPHAPVEWGLWVASHPLVAVLMSFMGVALETAFVVTAFVRTPRARAISAGVIGGSLLMGFCLFHGLLWWTWWLAFLSFVLPWQAIYDGVSSFVPAQVYHLDLSKAEGRATARFWHGLDWFDKLTFLDGPEYAVPGVHIGVTRALALMRSIPVLWPFLAIGRLAQSFRGIPAASDDRARAAVASPTGTASPSLAPSSIPAIAPPRVRGLQPVHGVLVCVLCLLVLREWPEGIGRFTSYSGTYASTDAFDQAFKTLQWSEDVWVNYGRSGARLVSAGPRREHQEFDVSTLDEQVLVDASMQDGALTLVEQGYGFDWQTGHFVPRDTKVIGTLAVGPRAPDGHLIVALETQDESGEN